MLKHVEQQKKEQQEILELCGEEFIMRIHDMINQFSVSDNGNLKHQATFIQTHSSFREVKPSLLDAEIPKRLLRSFEHILKK